MADEQNNGVPDLIGFVELENSGVLEDLAGSALSKHGYLWTAFANLPGMSLGIGFFFFFPITEARAHSITIGKETAPRPVLELRVEPRGKPLVFLLCHWKSKLGKDTEALRRASARVVQRRLREINQTETDTPVIVMGDLNENHDEYYRCSGAVLSALLPDDPDAAALASKEAEAFGSFIVLSGEKPPRASFFPEELPALYSPWDREMDSGSYYYRDDWETIDHFLLSDALFSGSFWDFAGCQVLNFAPFTKASGAPDSYVPRNGRGLSDHLPLLLSLSFTKTEN
jgi:endonuclease/exonuclease/phosphatase family metal-dependent hydrolase